jgi:hypothetical protein
VSSNSSAFNIKAVPNSRYAGTAIRMQNANRPAGKRLLWQS